MKHDKMYFEITHNTIERKIQDKKHNYCCFKFLTKDWLHKEKYIIFWTDKNKTIIKSLGKKCHSKINIPHDVNLKNFTIQIYTDDHLKTKRYTIGKPIQEEEKKDLLKPKSFDLVRKIFKELDTKIDNILYVDNVLKLCSNEEVIKTIDLVDKQLIKKILKEGSIEINVDKKLSTTSRNPVQNKVITEELNKKQDISSLSEVAQTGDYNDLKNIPSEFNPTHHNHIVVDVVDYEENINFDLGRLLDGLYDEIAKE